MSADDPSRQAAAPTEDGSRFTSGANRPNESSAGSVRRVSTSPRMTAMRSTGSLTPTGPASSAPANLLPPIGSSPRRRETGMAIGRLSTLVPCRS
jgi:hypothetical protein